MTTLLAHTAHALITGAVGCVLAAAGVARLYLRRTPMIPLTIQAWIGAGIAGCSLRAEVRAIRVPKLPAKWRMVSRGRHRKHWWQRSTMERWTRTIQRAQEKASIYVEPDWMAELREQWQFGDVDEFDAPGVGELGRYAHLRKEDLDSTAVRFQRIVEAGLRPPSMWGTPVEVDDWEPVEPQLVSRG